MANTNKTKAEILQELESIKGLLLEEDDIPILQETEFAAEEPVYQQQPTLRASPYTSHESVLPGQASLFEESARTGNAAPHTTETENKRHGVASHLNAPAQQQPANPLHTTQPQNNFLHTNPLQSNPLQSNLLQTNPLQTSRPLAKASGENPFLPQHIRERLHGNNPPPLFEYETAKKILNATKNVAHKINHPRQHLVDEVIKSMMPQIESELRHRLFAMSVDDLEKLLNEDED
ncbi:hypothetical protein [Cellvibrio mixtus]|uniref:hypothetical protein n=1 Tax=Cellvibrio mixtus TaxID=39650 RepID=UPI000587F8A7|nr:hypothetical protein [Cellvibrio mixtus]